VNKVLIYLFKNLSDSKPLNSRVSSKHFLTDLSNFRSFHKPFIKRCMFT